MSRQGYAGRRAIQGTALAAAALGLFACSPHADSSGPGATRGTRPGVVPETADGGLAISTYVDVRPAALVQGKVLEWGELRPQLSEAAGGVVLREAVIDRILKAELASAGITLTADDVERERSLFYESLNPDTDVSARLARELRARQGLGRARFDALLRRNAGLRALVRDQVRVTDESLRRTHEILHGPRRQARLMTLPGLLEAQSAIERVRSGEFFGEVAAELSTDSSAARGGLLEPVSRADPSYPEALREAIWGLDPGEVSPPVFLGQQYAVVTLVREVSGDGVTMEQAGPQLERQVRLSQERILMEQTARRLLSQATVTIIDESLKEGWDFQSPP